MESRNRDGARRAVVLTTDCGVDMDDQWALAHLALSPGLDLRGVVTAHAPNLAAPPAETAARVASEVLDQLPLADRPPVLPGSNTPLADRSPLPNAGVDFILDQAHRHRADDRLVVLVIGPATDLASALLTDPTLGDRIEVVAMAFDGWPEGHDGFNVRNDVASWQVVLESSAPVTVGDAAVTIRDLALTREGARAFLGESGPLGAYLVRLLDDWLDRYGEMARDVTGSAGAWPVWDEVVVAHLLGLTATVVRPRPGLREGPAFVHPDPPSGRTIAWITAVDAARLWGDLRQKVERAGSGPAGGPDAPPATP